MTIENLIEEKSNLEPRIILTDRDFDVLEFILNMKFASVEDVFNKFFRVTKKNLPAMSNLWAEDRLQHLEKAKLLKSERAFSENKRFYVATFKGYRVVSARDSFGITAKPLPGIDQRTFDHDKMVLRARMLLEQRDKITHFVSDRQLRSSSELAGGLSLTYVPDGVYTTPAGANVALEIEIAVKKRSRYRDKIMRLVSVMRSQDVNRKIFERVHYVCARKHVYKFLKSETNMYGDLFQIDMVDDFFAQTSATHSELAPSAYPSASGNSAAATI